jgi:spore cortex biosynthesis protein YabQ
VSLSVQFLTTGLMFVSGLALGTLYDIYRVAAGLLRISRWIIPLLDLVYWLVATLLVFRMLYFGNQGQVRMFIFLALLVGICFYYAFLSAWIVRLLHFLVKLSKMLTRFVLKAVDLLAVRPTKAAYRALVVVFGFVAALSVFFGKIVLQLLYPFRWLVRPLARWLKNRTGVPASLSRLREFVKNRLRRKP